jgi:hypothetical protein
MKISISSASSGRQDSRLFGFAQGRLCRKERGKDGATGAESVRQKQIPRSARNDKSRQIPRSARNDKFEKVD